MEEENKEQEETVETEEVCVERSNVPELLENGKATENGRKMSRDSRRESARSKRVSNRSRYFTTFVDSFSLVSLNNM